MDILRAILAAMLVLLSLGTPVVAGPLEDAIAAERRDDSGTAIQIYRSLAEKGSVEAYRRLGFFYEIGWGVKQNWVEAAKWYGKAVDAGDKDAAKSLGFIGRRWRYMYFGVPLDPIIYK